jgi:hypothetical protein
MQTIEIQEATSLRELLDRGRGGPLILRETNGCGFALVKVDEDDIQALSSAIDRPSACVLAAQFLKELDAQYFESLTEIAVRTTEIRWKAVTDLTDIAISKAKEIEGKDWPETLVKDTIAKIFMARERVANRIFRELDSDDPTEK